MMLTVVVPAVNVRLWKNSQLPVLPLLTMPAVSAPAAGVLTTMSAGKPAGRPRGSG